jgi:aspartate/methionine/tyrosine aminotransferase
MEFKALEKVGFDTLMSDFGKRIFLPQGIFYWSGRAKKEAKINATIGTAKAKQSDLYEDGDDSFVTCHLPSMKKFFPDMGSEQIFPYAPIAGYPAFRQAWKKYLLYKAGDQADAIENNLMTPIASCGITGALHLMVKLFADEGEPVVCPEKRWGNYDNIVQKNIQAKFLSFVFFKDGKFNTAGLMEAIEKVWQEHDKALVVLNFPNNPTGYMPSAEEMDEVRQEMLRAVEASGKRIIILFDDAYEGYVYDDSAMEFSPFYDFVNIDDRILPVKMDGIAKELLWYGGRIGMITFGLPDAWLNEVPMAELEKEIENKVAGSTRSSNSNYTLLTQVVVTQALQDIPGMIQERKKTIDVLTGRYKEWAKHSAKFDPNLLVPDPAQAGFFAFVNVKGAPANKVAETLLTKYEVGTVPQVKEAEGINGIRVAFCSVEAKDIEQLCQSLEQAVKDEQS